ncbi:MAG TPA: ABC transporter ATP-binding protein [Fodinibius sp.]|nr:ABC transporter ATP-binding protein [Fodinibius sp.]
MAEIIIKVSDLTKTYQMGNQEVKALDGVSFDVLENEYIAIMGPSGSGKSTMMNLIGCLDTPTRGTYILNGQDVSKLDDAELAEVRNREIGFVFQTFNLLPRTDCLSNVELPLIYSGIKTSERYERAAKTLERVGLGDRIDHKPNELSGGQRQRVAIARALVNNPSILLADEPTGNLDSKTGQNVLGLLKLSVETYHQTLVMITHNLELAQMADRIIRIEDGRIRA